MTASTQYVQFASQGLTPKQVQALTGGRRRAVRLELSRAHEALDRNAEEAIALLERSSLATAQLKGGVSGAPVMSKSRWEEIILGVCHLPS